MTLTDVVKYQVCEANMKMCEDYACNISFILHDWKAQIVPSNMHYHDTIICSDVLYDRSSFNDLESTLQQLHFHVLLLAYKQRHPE